MKQLIFLLFTLSSSAFINNSIAAPLTCPEPNSIHWQNSAWQAPQGWRLMNNPAFSRTIKFATVQYGAKYHKAGEAFDGTVQCYYELDSGTLLMLKLTKKFAFNLPPPGGSGWQMNIVYPPLNQTPGYLNGYCGSYNQTMAKNCILAKKSDIYS
ncbi:hypothetical protein [Piscirickettsia litoralis]|uniref:DUF3757 domain-containing protein n=1 Tax=Piscirickettsia litoralis TaxID=1891921 RepID=A0ABX3A2A0_9GAMM|nr:hypothetical protein [Piscirickettsia litoralis]ODN41781.1 hypothetical protein BGC07_00775 [Piscirickettsia litoralis]